MKRGGTTYADGNSNQYAASQRQMMQQNAAGSDYSVRADVFRAEEERQYAAGKPEGQWQWDRDAQRMSPTLYGDAKAANATYASRSFYPDQIPDAKMHSNQESRIHPQEQDMEVGFEDNPAPQTLEGLNKKIYDDIMKLTQEQVDTEDAENARHKEKIIEINNQYQEKLSALRVRIATKREEFLLKESELRLQQYQFAKGGPFKNNIVPGDASQSHHGYGGAPGPVPGEPPRQYGGGHFDSYRHPELYGRGRIQGADSRVPTPGGRVYNTGPRYH